jgi:hypothetical protein
MAGWWFGTCLISVYGIILPIGYYFSRWLKPPTRWKYAIYAIYAIWSFPT